MLYVVLEIMLHSCYVSSLLIELHRPNYLKTHPQPGECCCCLWVLLNDAVSLAVYRRVTEQLPVTCRDRLYRNLGLAC
jgi:hypothetical protein